MKKELVIGILIGLVCLLVIGKSLLNQKPAQKEKVNTISNTTSKTIYTVSDVETHNTQIDCWMIINGNVYDLTAYFSHHPGGDDTMSPYCGKDATVAYNTKGRNQPHSAKADEELATYLKGNFTQ